MTPLYEAIVQAIHDSDTHPDGPMLSERFWELLRQEGIYNEAIADARKLSEW